MHNMTPPESGNDLPAETLPNPGIDVRFHLDHTGFSLDVDFAVPVKGVTALFGPSGSGKTSLLRCMAGLEKAARGFLSVAGEVWQDDSRGIFLPVYRRSLGFVFQEANLFPHLTVSGNLHYGRKRAKDPIGEKDVAAILDLLGITHLQDRYPGRLSGGERQRVAIGRALLTRPRLLLMDEPLASLDQQRKLEILPYLERLHEELQCPVVYVSHSPDEVARLADHIVVLEEGRIVAGGSLVETMARIDLPSVFAEEEGVVLEAIVAEHDSDSLTRLEFPGGSLFIALQSHSPGQKVRCRVHARDVSIALTHSSDTSILNILPAVIDEISSAVTPGHVLVRMTIGGTPIPLIARITERSLHHLSLKKGAGVYAQVKSVALLA